MRAGRSAGLALVLLLLALAGAVGIHAPAILAQDRGALRFKPVDSDKPEPLYSDSFALVIGIDDYTNGWTKLNNAVKDAEAVAAALTQIGFTVRLETTAQTELDPSNPTTQRKKALTGARLNDIIREFLYDAGKDPQARLFIWFAGHGESIKGAWPGQPSAGYLIGADAPNPSRAPQAQRAALEAQMRQKSVSLELLGVILNEVPAKHIMGVFDSCFVGTIFTGLRNAGPPPTIRRSVANPTRLFFTSGSEGQTVRDDGLFRREFVDAILGRVKVQLAGDGYLTGKRLGDYLKRRLADELRTEQVPQFGPTHRMANSEGDFVFTISPEAMARLDAKPELPPLAMLHERFWGFVREENSPALIERYVKTFPDTPFKEVAVAQAKRLRDPIKVAAKDPSRDKGTGAPEGAHWITLPAGPPVSKDWFALPVFYGTDRARKGTTFGSDRGNRLEVGRAMVTIPAIHQTGLIERPSPGLLGTGLLKDSLDPKRHFAMQAPLALPVRQFDATIKALLPGARTNAGQALLYIHGYNTGFEDAVLRAAQLAFDLGFDGPVLAYSWPSGGTVTGYAYDFESALKTEPHLRAFLERVAREAGVARIHVVAHGMGNGPLMRVLADSGRTGNRETLKIGQVIAAAPDVDRDGFEAVCVSAARIVDRITIYASTDDRALQVSRRLSGGQPRAGEVSATGPLVNPCAQTVDITALSTDFLALNHSGYAARSDVLGDIKRTLVATGETPDQRNPSLKRVETPAGVYWRAER